MEEIQITKEISKIIDKNLNEKNEQIVKKIDCCKNCRFYDKPWIWGDVLHCCSYNSKDPQTSRNIKKLYDNCPMGHEITVTKSYIKKYGIIHKTPKKDEFRSESGRIAIVDFSGTTFEWDGYNPDVDWTNIAIFFYDTQEECDIIMDMVLDYYHRFNLDAPYIEKHCYG